MYVLSAGKNWYLCALWGGWEKELEAAKRKFSPPVLFLPLILNVENRMKAICFWYTLDKLGKML